LAISPIAAVVFIKQGSAALALMERPKPALVAICFNVRPLTPIPFSLFEIFEFSVVKFSFPVLLL